MRYERKYHTDQCSAEQMKLWIRTHPAHFHEVYPPRVVSNIYFDTTAMSDYHDHVNGAASRSKMRLRWYGSHKGPSARAALEVKCKQGQVGSKRVCAVEGLSETHISNPWSIAETLRGLCVDDVIRERLTRSSPALFNTYSRKYFASVDHWLRLTLDTNVTVQTIPGRPFASRSRFLDERLLILELKYDTEREPDVSRVLRNWPFRLGRVSKYVYGVQRLHGIDLPLV